MIDKIPYRKRTCEENQHKHTETNSKVNRTLPFKLLDVSHFHWALFIEQCNPILTFLNCYIINTCIACLLFISDHVAFTISQIARVNQRNGRRGKTDGWTRVLIFEKNGISQVQYTCLTIYIFFFHISKEFKFYTGIVSFLLHL